MIEPAPAKVNLALHLRRRLADGYHELETIFAFTEFGDTLHAAPADALSLSVEGAFAGAAGQGADNLVLRAASALQAASGAGQGAALRLEKGIPVAAGLGGGSADAAAALRLLNRMWGLDWPMVRLEHLAASLGADVAACVRMRTCFGARRGELLSPWPVAFTGTPVLLINPGVAVPTGPVFQAWDQIDRGGIMSTMPLDALRNDMTTAAVGIAPVIADVLAALDALPGIKISRMSGSGATCLALFDDAAHLAEGAAAMAARGWWHMATRLR